MDLRITLDTNILISAAIWETSVCNKFIRKLLHYEAQLFTTPDIIREFMDILKRDFAHDSQEIENEVKTVLKTMRVIYPQMNIFAVEADPSDNKILECAVISNSDYIITYDKHLLAIKEFRGIKIVTPEVMLKAIG